MIAAKWRYSYLAKKQSALRRLQDFYSSIFTHGLVCQRRSSQIKIPSLHQSMLEDYAQHLKYAKISPLHTILEQMGSWSEPISGWNNFLGVFVKIKTSGTSGYHLWSSCIINGHMKQQGKPHLI